MDEGRQGEVLDAQSEGQMQHILIFVNLISLEVTACGFSCVSGFLNLALLTFGDSEFFVVGTVHCIVGCIAAFLASTHR